MKKKKDGTVFVSWHTSAPLEYEFTDPSEIRRALLEIIKEAGQEYAAKQYREVNSGAVWNEDEPGKYGADLNTADGLMKLRGATLEKGSLESPRPLANLLSSTVAEEQTSSQLWDELLGAETPVDRKAEALALLIAEGSEQVAAFVVSELGKTAIQPDWLDKLIFATEQIEFRDPSTRATLKERLQHHATLLLQSGRLRSENALWAAMRRYASLIEESEIQALQPFLEGKASLATRQATLQAIHAIFQQSPPSDPAGLRALADRVDQIAVKYVDPELLVSPENTSLALNAVVALSALGSRGAISFAARMRETGNRWLMRRGAQALDGLLAAWRSKEHLSVEQQTAIRNVADCLSELRREG